MAFKLRPSFKDERGEISARIADIGREALGRAIHVQPIHQRIVEEEIAGSSRTDPSLPLRWGVRHHERAVVPMSQCVVHRFAAFF